jgi:6-phosphogluconolactonase (cycloisomerase 2 family)
MGSGWRRFGFSSLCALAAVAALPAGAAQLQFVEAEFDGVGGVDGLDGARAVVVSPGGEHLYAAAAQDDAVAVFARDPATGELTFVEAELDGVGGVDGLDGAEHLALSPGGETLYVVGLLDGGLAVFSRDGTTGELTFLEAHLDGVAGVNGLAGASSVAVSPDGEHVYATGRFDDALAVFDRNPANGRLTFLDVEIDGAGGVDGLAAATWVAVSPDGEHVYAAGVEDQEVAVFERSPATGLLTFVAAVADTLPDAQIDIDDHHSLAFSADGAFLYVGNHVEDPADGWIATFSRNPASGTLTAVPPVLLATAVDAGCLFGIEGDTGMAVSPDGRRFYANHPWESAVVAFDRDPATGLLAFDSALCDESIGMGSDPNAVDGLFASQGTTLSPDGRFVYVASSNLEDAVAVVAGPIFTDGFESGDTSRWSAAVP